MPYLAQRDQVLVLSASCSKGSTHLLDVFPLSIAIPTCIPLIFLDSFPGPLPIPQHGFVVPVDLSKLNLMQSADLQLI